MRTLQVINVQWYNATAWYAVHLAHSLNQAGHDSIVVGIKDSLPLVHAKKLGLEVYELPLNSLNAKDIWQCNIGINDICHSFKPDIVNCHRGESFLLWALKKRKFNYKLIRTRGDQRFPTTNIINRVLHKDCTDAVIVTNSKMSNYFSSKLHVPSNQLHTILGGVDTNNFYPSQADRDSMRIQYGFTDNDVVVGIVGRLDPVKGHKEVLPVFANICKQEANVQDGDLTTALSTKLHLLIVGGDCYYTINDLCILGQELGIPQGNLHCVPYVENMQKLMCMLDVGLIASLSSEAIARVAFEMIACHVPIIGSNVGVMPDILDDKYLYDPYDHARLSKLLLLSKEFVFRRELLDFCIKRFEGNNSIYGWSLDRFLEKTLTVYRDCLT